MKRRLWIIALALVVVGTFLLRGDFSAPTIENCRFSAQETGGMVYGNKTLPYKGGWIGICANFSDKKSGFKKAWVELYCERTHVRHKVPMKKSWHNADNEISADFCLEHNPLSDGMPIYYSAILFAQDKAGNIAKKKVVDFRLEGRRYVDATNGQGNDVEERAVYIYETKTGKLLHHYFLRYQHNPECELTFSDNGKFVACGYGDSVKILRLSDGSLTGLIKKPGYRLEPIMFYPVASSPVYKLLVGEIDNKLPLGTYSRIAFDITDMNGKIEKRIACPVKWAIYYLAYDKRLYLVDLGDLDACWLVNLENQKRLSVSRTAFKEKNKLKQVAFSGDGQICAAIYHYKSFPGPNWISIYFLNGKKYNSFSYSPTTTVWGKFIDTFRLSWDGRYSWFVGDDVIDNKTGILVGQYSWEWNGSDSLHKPFCVRLKKGNRYVEMVSPMLWGMVNSDQGGNPANEIMLDQSVNGLMLYSAKPKYDERGTVCQLKVWDLVADKPISSLEYSFFYETHYQSERLERAYFGAHDRFIFIISDITQ